MEARTDSSKRTVLIAEDDVLIRMPMAEFLRGCGYRVLEAKSIDEAILLIEGAMFAPEVVVSNAELAGDCFGIARWIRENQPSLTLLLTGTPKRAVDVAASPCENAPLPSPNDLQILHRRLSRLIANRNRPERQSRRTGKGDP
jgi:CheY-like chemotaxis protein